MSRGSSVRVGWSKGSHDPLGLDCYELRQRTQTVNSATLRTFVVWNGPPTSRIRLEVATATVEGGAAALAWELWSRDCDVPGIPVASGVAALPAGEPTVGGLLVHFAGILTPSWEVRLAVQGGGSVAVDLVAYVDRGQQVQEVEPGALLGPNN